MASPIHATVLGPILAASLATAAAASAASPPPPLQATHARPLTDVVFERTPARIERGRYLAEHAIGCVLCHSDRDRTRPGAPPVAGREFAGSVIAEGDGYRTVAPNLTPDVETGAGSWPDDALARAIREGVGHDGRGIGGAMWWWAFRALSDEDVAAIVAHLRSLPPVRNPLPPRLLPPEAEAERAAAARPLEGPVPEPDVSTAADRGRYLIAIADCMGCHTGWTPPATGAFAGGNRIERWGEAAWSVNLTPDPSGIGSWTPAIFRARIRDGRGGTLHFLMPWAAYRGMTDEDLDAIFAALSEVPPIRHLVNNVDPPTDCPVCGGRHGLGASNVARTLERGDVDLGPLEAFVGTFRLADDAVEMAIALRDGTLLASEDGAPPVELVPGPDGRLHGIGLISPLAFERDASGRVVSLLSFELGTSRWPRVGD